MPYEPFMDNLNRGYAPPKREDTEGQDAAIKCVQRLLGHPHQSVRSGGLWHKGEYFKVQWLPQYHQWNTLNCPAAITISVVFVVPGDSGGLKIMGYVPKEVVKAHGPDDSRRWLTDTKLFSLDDLCDIEELR